ncbi:MAG: EAL domain-containing protein [Butyrivibrio sp.]|nr:EAL domain-containing protein [Butyrivibrio sp.]
MSQSLYVLLLLLCANVIAVYVYSKIKRGSLVSNKVIALLGVPSIVGALLLILGRVYYATSNNGTYYNFGPVINSCYCLGLLYVVGTLIFAVIFRNRLRNDEPVAIISGLSLWIVMVLFQFYNRSIQVSSIAVMLMALILFIAVENPKEYYERQIHNVRNKEALDIMMVERMGVKRNFFIASVIFTGKTNALSGEDRQKLTSMQESVATLVKNEMNEPAYLFAWNTISFFIKSPEKVEKLMELIGHVRTDDSTYRLTFAVLEPLRYTDNVDEATQVMSYVSGDYVYSHSTPFLAIDRKLVEKMIYRNSVEDIVRKSLEQKAFDVYYQPILNVNEGRFTSAEALVRLRRPQSENYISPEDFIPIAEKCGLIKEIDDIVFEKVCSFIVRENLSSYGIKHVEVNLSGNEVVDRQTHDRLISKMEKYHISPDFINFEITETAYINNDEVFKENVQKLKELGTTFSMDDFGSGYSNLLELLKMDYMLVKMDKEFIWSCLDKNKPENMRMLEYSIGFLKDYGLHVLAEGVETVDQAETLIEKGVEYLQGFYYSRPISETDFIEFLKAQKGV